MRDLYGYRRYGHNEADEPRFTQPIMYSAVDQKPSVREVYVQRLIESGLTHDVQCFIAALKGWVRANLDWSIETGRYARERISAGSAA